MAHQKNQGVTAQAVAPFLTVRIPFAFRLTRSNGPGVLGIANMDSCFEKPPFMAP